MGWPEGKGGDASTAYEPQEVESKNTTTRERGTFPPSRVAELRLEAAVANGHPFAAVRTAAQPGYYDWSTDHLLWNAGFHLGRSGTSRFALGL